ncbi:hypothetical protein, partial [Pseudomonas viridiflava]|uniref:hypothetical protein n=1 Tax=Pseudomonas viridiflava TaxID=33069 RepID=UPI00198139DA
MQDLLQLCSNATQLRFRIELRIEPNPMCTPFNDLTEKTLGIKRAPDDLTVFLSKPPRTANQTLTVTPEKSN